MIAYREAICKLEGQFAGLELNHVHREHNEGVDSLPKVSLEQQQNAPQVLFCNTFTNQNTFWVVSQ